MNKNQKGFTLVELIVVMALMAIIMGAVMAIMSPTAKFHNKVENTTNQEAVCIAVGDAIANEIQYARKVAVYYNDTNPGAPPSCDYTKLITIDNTSRSGSKKGAPGVVTKSDADGTNSSVIMGEPFYGEDAYGITIGEYSSDSGKCFLMLDFEGCPMKYEGGAYVKNTDVIYNYSKSITFTNINNSSMLKNTTASLTVNIRTDNSKIYIYYEPIS